MIRGFKDIEVVWDVDNKGGCLEILIVWIELEVIGRDKFFK